MKKLILSLFILFSLTTAKAQYRDQLFDKRFFLSVGGQVGAPSSTPFNLTYGGAVQAEVKPINRLGVTLAAEYIAYKYKGAIYGTGDQHPSFIPLKAGIKYYSSPNFYFAGEIGSTVQSSIGMDNMLVYSLGFGFAIPLDKHNDIDIGFSYQNYTFGQYQTTDLKVAYRFGW